MEAIEYLQPKDLPVAKFKLPAEQQRVEGPRVQRSKAAAAAPAPGADAETLFCDCFPLADQLPLYPGWLPAGFNVEGLLLLEYVPERGNFDQPSLVYQFEIFGPGLGDMLSLFQTRASEFGMNLEASGALGQGVLVEQQGDWIIAIMGDQSTRVLQRIIDGLTVIRNKLPIC